MSRCGNPHLDTRRAVCYCICNSVNCAASHGARRVSVPRPAAPVLTALPAAPPPDALLVLTDWRDGAPLALVTGLRMRWPWPAPVIWSASSHPLRLVAALNAGAGGYVHVDAPLPDLMAVLRVAQRGGAACCALTAAALRARLFGCPSLTEREAQVAALVLCYVRFCSFTTGYRRLSLMRASAVVKCHITLLHALLRRSSQAETSRLSVLISGIGRSKHCLCRTESSHSAILSQLPCSGV
jgi:hypothetical protein